MGWVSMALNLGTCVGLVLGGLAVYLGKEIGCLIWESLYSSLLGRSCLRQRAISWGMGVTGG